MGRSNRRLIIVLAAILALCLVILVIVFNVFTSRYLENVTYDSASHLVEIDHQTRAYIEGIIKDDQGYTEGLVKSIDAAGFEGEGDLLDYLTKMRDLWGVDSIRLYASDGVCIDESGVVQSRDDASRFAYEVLKGGSLFEITDSVMEYGVALDTAVELDGRSFVAVSLVRNLDTLIDDMGLTSFGGEGYLYLTQGNGVKISQSTSGSAPVVFNISSLFDEGSMRCISDDGLALADAMAEGRESVYIFTDPGGTSRYVVMTPVSAADKTWLLFYEVPELVVNEAMNSFSSYVVMLAISVVFIFLVLLAVFYLVYRTRSRRYLADMRTREHLFDLLVSETDNAYMLLSHQKGADGEGKLLYASSNTGKMLGTDTPRVVMEDGHLRFEDPDDGCTSVLDRIDQALASWDGTGDFMSDYIPYGDAGDPRYLILEIYPVQESADEYIGIVQDVTDVRRREEDIRNALVMADSANRAKTKFLSSMSHDIRTPMNAIVNMTRFAIKDADDPVKTRKDLEVIQGSSEHLLKLINDVLDMSRVESGKLSLSAEPMVLSEILADVCEIIEPLCDAKGQTFSKDWGSITHDRVIGDSLRLNQVLINLLNNAVKFTPDGGNIGLSVHELRSLKDDTVIFSFDVRDDGIGMDAKTEAHIFEPFSRSDDAVVKTTEGSGLGLSITKSFIDAAGGSIKVESTVGKGSDFMVELFFPIDTSAILRPADTGADAVLDDARFDGRRALLVEDNEINRTIASVLLTELGFEVETAADGAEAVRLFCAHGSGYFDIIYMDIQMPVMDGYGATAAIRKSEVPDGSNVPIVAMTANVFAEDVENARRAGMDGHIGKPIDPDALRQETAKLLHAKR